MKKKVVVELMHVEGTPEQWNSILRDGKGNLFYNTGLQGKGHAPQYMHICDPEAEIKEDDSVIFKSKLYKQPNNPAVIYGVRKIVAANDPKLQAEGIPGISEQFIKEYVSCNGECEVEMEMTVDWCNGICLCHGRSEQDYCLRKQTEDSSKWTYKPKKEKGNLVLLVVEKEINLSEVAEKLKDRVLFPESVARVNKLLENMVIPPNEQAIQKQIEDASKERYPVKMMPRGTTPGEYDSNEFDRLKWLSGVEWARKNIPSLIEAGIAIRGEKKSEETEYSEAYKLGQKHHALGYELARNPFSSICEEKYMNWRTGWLDASDKEG